MSERVECGRPGCERLHDPTRDHVGAPDYCSGLCASKDSTRAREAAARAAARAVHNADVSRANLEKARAAQAAQRAAKSG